MIRLTNQNCRLPAVSPVGGADVHPAPSGANASLGELTPEPAMAPGDFPVADPPVVLCSGKSALDGRPVYQIQKIVAEEFGISVRDILSEKRGCKWARPRQIAMWLAREKTLYSLPTIGRLFGNRDHTTVLHAIRKVLSWREESTPLACTIDRLDAKIIPAESSQGEPALMTHIGIVSDVLASKIARELVRVSQSNPHGLLAALKEL